jgi:hydroxyethylthiazole kinase
MKAIEQHLEALRSNSPLVHNITNYVVMNYTANSLLAVGASPVMAHAVEEVEDLVSIAGALVVNIGTLSAHWVDSMQRAMAKALELGKPVVLDPVGAGATPYRNRILADLLQHAPPTLIRGNASEIMALAGLNVQTKGVDSTASSLKSIQAAQMLNECYGAVVSVSGPVDVIVSKDKIGYIRNGHPIMSRITGMGCTASAIAGAFCAVTADPFEATLGAAATMGVCGELAAETSTLPGSFQIAFLDALSAISPNELTKRVSLEIQNN